MIFCVEDDAGIRNMMVYTLNTSGFEATGFSDGSEFFEALSDVKPDLVILDIMLPIIDGLTLLKTFRASNTATPVIMLTAKDSLFRGSIILFCTYRFLSTVRQIANLYQHRRGRVSRPFR